MKKVTRQQALDLFKNAENIIYNGLVHNFDVELAESFISNGTHFEHGINQPREFIKANSKYFIFNILELNEYGYLEFKGVQFYTYKNNIIGFFGNYGMIYTINNK